MGEVILVLHTDHRRDRFAQNSNGSIHIARRSPNTRASKLHRTIADPLHSHRSAWKRETTAKVHLSNHVFVPPRCLSVSEEINDLQW
ncbi:hypothetical protein [uncultured Nostoc sp.]|uniref:hypothetical protein n=1 Tax=uncultured Nostoc sp. TaxID=340711 RepID=UPI0035CA0867